MKEEKALTFQKAESDLAQDVQGRALTVNTSNTLKGELRSSLKQCDGKPT